MNVGLRAKNLINKFHSRDPLFLAKRLGIEIVYADLGDVKGFYKKILRRKFIFINSEMSEIEKKIVCGHELGHAYLHSSKDMQFMLDKTNLLRRTNLEYEANLFMKCLVFSDEYSSEFFRVEELKKISYKTIEELKHF